MRDSHKAVMRTVINKYIAFYLNQYVTLKGQSIKNVISRYYRL